MRWPGPPWDVAISDGLAYLAEGQDGLGIMDVSDPGAPVRIGSYDTEAWALVVDVSQSLAYVAGWDGMEIIDVTVPTEPWRIGKIAGDVRDVGLAANTLYVALGPSGVQVFDVSNPETPQRVSTYFTDGSALKLAVAGDTLYVAKGLRRLEIIDASDPDRLQRLGGIDGQVWDVAVSGDYAFVVGGSRGLEVLDVSDPLRPRPISGYVTNAYSQSVSVAGGLAYVATSWQIEIIDVLNDTATGRHLRNERLGTESGSGRGRLLCVRWARWVQDH